MKDLAFCHTCVLKKKTKCLCRRFRNRYFSQASNILLLKSSTASDPQRILGLSSDGTGRLAGENPRSKKLGLLRIPWDHPQLNPSRTLSLTDLQPFAILSAARKIFNKHWGLKLVPPNERRVRRNVGAKARLMGNG
jgi:hypothetical protein